MTKTYILVVIRNGLVLFGPYPDQGTADRVLRTQPRSVNCQVVQLESTYGLTVYPQGDL